jgi:hypothetical protein
MLRLRRKRKSERFSWDLKRDDDWHRRCSEKTMTLSGQLDGKRALIEMRESRRVQRLVVATLKKEDDGVFAVFHERYPQH